MKHTRNPVSELNGVDRKWLEGLLESKWKRSRDRFNMEHWFEQGELTESQWARVKRLVHTYALPCVMNSGPYGNLAISIYTHPSNPGIPPDFVSMVGQGNLPGFGAREGGYEKRHPAAWDALSALTHSERNKELLMFYELPPSRDASCYEY